MLFCPGRFPDAKNNYSPMKTIGSLWFIQTAAVSYRRLGGPDGIHWITIERLYLIGF